MEDSTVVSKKMTHARLDRLLDRAARDLESYDVTLDALIEDLDRRGVSLEMVDPIHWRKAGETPERRPNASIEEQFRVEVDAIEILNREDEARLARRIEFARRRADKAFERAGLDPAEMGKGPVGRGGAQSGDSHVDPHHDCQAPQDVCARWHELHQLRKEMVERNLYLVLINVERYAHTRASRLDLIQEGASALFRAVDGFDWRRGLLFRTYAVHWLNQAFRSFLYNFGNTVRVPVYLQKAMKHVHDAIIRLGDPSASVERIAEEADLNENIVSAALEASRSTHSMDAVFGSDDDGGSLREMIGGEDDGEPYDPTMEDISLKDGVEMALDRLSDRERYVIVRRFGIGTDREQTLAEIAGRLGVSLERVRQIQVRAIAKMKTPKLRKAIDPFLL